MVKDVHSFFATKIAQDDPRKVIDPGEAAAAGLAMASGILSQYVVPPVTSHILSQLGPPEVPWGGPQVSGVSKMKPFLKDLITANTPEDIGKWIGTESQTRKLLNLFKVHPKIAPVEFSGEAIKTLGESYETIDKMIDRYDLARKGVKIELTPSPLAAVTGPKYHHVTKTIRTPSVNEEHILHELGHAAHETGVGAKAFGTIRNLAGKAGIMSIPMAFIAGNEIQKMLPGTVDDKIIDFVRNNAPAIMAASYAATELYPEVQATTRAVHHVYKTKGAKAAKKTLKALIPPMLSHVVPLIPILVGVSLAKKWYMKSQKQEKNAGYFSELGRVLWETVVPIGSSAAHMAGQVGRQASELLQHSPQQVAKTLWHAGVDTVKSPAFASGAAMAGIPAATFAYVYHNTPTGKAYRRGLSRYEAKGGAIAKAQADLKDIQEKARDDSVTWPAIAGIGAALSGGFLAKLWSDIAHAL